MATETFWSDQWLNNNILNKVNSWEYFKWNEIDTGTEISHLAFEDIRKRIWLFERPTAGKKTIQESYESWMQIKWAYGDAVELIDRQYEDTDGNIITLEAGEYRWSVTNGSAQLRQQIADLTASMIYPGQLFLWDGNFTPNNLEYIPPLLFTVDNGFNGYTNTNSLTPPINRDTGLINTNIYSLVPDPNYYHDYDPNAQTRICGHWSKMPSPPPNDQSYYYNTSISAYRYLPTCTDPKEQDYPIHCWDSANGSWIWQINKKVELSQSIINNLPHISHYITDENEGCNGQYSPHPGSDLLCRWMGVQGPSNFMYSQNFGLQDTCGKFRGYIPWPRSTPFCLYQGHPPTEYYNRARKYTIGKDESWTEVKYDQSYWAQIERVLEQNTSYYYPVNESYKTNWLRKNNIYDNYEGKYIYGGSSPIEGEYNANKYSDQDDYALANSDYWNCNSSHQELILKILGIDYYVWVLDYNSVTTYQHYDMVRLWYKNYFCGVSIEELNRELPWSVFCWRRIPKWQMGRYDYDNEDRPILYWSAELGNPPGQIEDDYRMPITQEQYDAIPERLNYKDLWYRIVNLNDIFNTYFDKVGQYRDGTNFDQWGLNYLDVPNTPEGLTWINNNWYGGERLPHPEDSDTLISHEAWIVYHTHPTEVSRRDRDTYIERSLKYEIRAEQVKHMRHMLLIPQYKQIEPSWSISTNFTGGVNMIKGWGGMKPLGEIGGDYPTLCGGLRYNTYVEAFDAAAGIVESIYKSPPSTTTQFNNQIITLNNGQSFNSTYCFSDYGQPRSWNSCWNVPGQDTVGVDRGWFIIGKNVEINYMNRGRTLCGEGENDGGYAAWHCSRSDACIIINDNSIIPDGAILYGRIFTWVLNIDPMPFKAFDVSIYPNEGIENYWISVGVGEGDESRWYYINHMKGWTERIQTLISFHGNNNFFYKWDYEPPAFVWDRRTIYHHNITDCSIYPDWMKGIDLDGDNDSNSDGINDHHNPRNWRDDYKNDTPEFNDGPAVEDDGNY